MRMQPKTVPGLFQKSIRATVAITLIIMFLVTVPVAQASPPTYATPSKVDVKGSGTFFNVTIKLTAHENGTYGVKISEIAIVTLKFDLINHGWSENKTLANGQTYNFSVQLRTKTASLGQVSNVTFEVYENQVLVGGDHFGVDVAVIDTGKPSDIKCGLIIPLIIVGGLSITYVGRIKPRREA
jgi:hypothetical protein